MPIGQWQAALALVVLAAHPLACGGQKAKKAHHAPYDTYQGGPRAIMDVPAHACMPAQQWDAATLTVSLWRGGRGLPGRELEHRRWCVLRLRVPVASVLACPIML